jgi:cephalosporin hydroxylase
MKIVIDTDSQKLFHDAEGVPLYSDAAFKLLSRLWLNVGWNQKHIYTFTWLGVPVIQLPEDMLRYQELVFRIKPDVIVETGIAHGGSAVYSASLLKLLGKGRVIAVDIDIRAHNRSRLEAHPLRPLITLIEGSSVAPEIVKQVRDGIRPDESVLVVLDSDHSYAHVSAELAAYAPLVTLGSYILATDGVMREVAGAPRGKPSWCEDNPAQAAEDFIVRNTDFVIEEPDWLFNESTLRGNITHWPQAWLRRVR